MKTKETPPAEGMMLIDNVPVAIGDERNVLEVARKAGIDIPTFCYHSELSIYGACRLCLVDIEGRGIVASCSIGPETGMRVRTNTEEIRKMRRVACELLLANHDMDCPTCSKSATCRLQELARKLGVDRLRYKPLLEKKPVDESSHALLRNPNRCVLCGDCVRACHEIQGVGAIDFAWRGAASAVTTAFDRGLADVECVNCGQCAAVCPTGAITVKPEVGAVWKLIDDPGKTVVVQVAPAVRAGIGEYFGMKPGSLESGRMVAALKRLGFDQVYDTGFSADMTVLEEAGEFLDRLEKGEKLPQFTSCCPAWVKFAEQYYPEFLPNLSSCRSPQQMFGSIARRILPEKLGTEPDNLAVVSLMPCTAKKYEARLDKFSTAGRPDVDHVITTQELGRMIETAGIDFDALEPASFDMPLGFKTGAGVIFGVSGGVTEAVLRYAAEKIQGAPLEDVEFRAVRGEAGMREAVVEIGETRLRLAIVHGLANARRLADRLKNGEAEYDLIEVMSCPGGCIAGAGQPPALRPDTRHTRARALYHNDREMQLHNASENIEVLRCYETHLDGVGGADAHRLLHTVYQNRRRISGGMALGGSEKACIRVEVCTGTTCFLRGSQKILQGLMEYVEAEGLYTEVEIRATFCFERCGKAPNVRVGDIHLEKCTLEMAKAELDRQLNMVSAGS